MRLKFAVLVMLFLLVPTYCFAQKPKGQSTKKAQTSTNKSIKKQPTPKPEEQPSQAKEQTTEPALDNKQEKSPQASSQTPASVSAASPEASTPATPAAKPKKAVLENSDIEAHGLSPEVKGNAQPQNNNANSDEFAPKPFDQNGYTRKDGTYVTPRIGGRGRVPIKKQ